MANENDDPNRTYTMAELMARGAEVYKSNCAVCHQPTGKGAGVFPALDGSKIVNGPIANHVSIVLNGKGAMPTWGKTLNDVEIASVITFERNSWGNHTGDILQPRQVADARNGKMPEGGNHLSGAAAAPAGASAAPAASGAAAASGPTASIGAKRAVLASRVGKVQSEGGAARPAPAA
jgi:cytochrome c oxidase subunit 2